MKTYLQLKNEIRAVIWPSGEPENLKGVNTDGTKRAHELLFEEGMADIQKWVECERDNNVNTIPACGTWFKCGMTVVDMPCGVIDRVYTVVLGEGGDWCDPVFYRERDWPLPEKLARNLADYDKPPFNEDYPLLPVGMQFPSSESDSVCGRARTGIWAKWKGKLYIYPWLQTYETLVIEWRGRKTVWSETDPVNPDILLRTALKTYVQFAHQRDFGEPLEMKKFEEQYRANALPDLIHDCTEKMKRRNDLDYEDIRRRTEEELADDTTPEVDEMVVAHIGNHGANNSASQNVVDLIKTWHPSFIISSGDVLGDNDYDTDMGQFYGEFMFPYNGTYGNGAAVNLFWPAPGDKDWDLAGLATYRSWFRLPNNERYYDIVRGEAHFFFIDSDEREPDTNLQGGAQGVWLQSKLALSTATWKIVVLHHPPYSSAATNGSNADLQWPFATWGADLVLAAHAGTYERLTVDDITYIVNGMGGADLETFASSPLSESESRYQEEWGAVKLRISSEKIVVEFWDRYNFRKDQFEITA